MEGRRLVEQGEDRDDDAEFSTAPLPDERVTSGQQQLDLLTRTFLIDRISWS